MQLKSFISVLVFFATAVFNLNVISAEACTIVGTSLRQRFRKADNVFAGRLVSVADATQKIDEFGRIIGGVAKFEIAKGWKGKKSGTIDLYSNIIDFGCGNGSPPFMLEVGKDYLVFDRKGYVDVSFTPQLARSEKDVRRLDDFWFRTWARIYPF